jgi:hypothetical protein
VKPENRFLNLVHKHLPNTVYFEKTHNIYRGGTPDVYYEGPKTILWAEYKYLPKLPKTINLIGQKTPPLSALQQRWLTRAQANNVNVAVIIGSPQGNFVLENLSWKEPHPVDQLASMLVAEIASWIQMKTC